MARYRLQRLQSMLRRFQRPVLRLVEGRAGRSKWGGHPLVPAGFPWPHTQVPKRGPRTTGLPFCFVMQLDLAALPALPGLPGHGLLSVFVYDAWDSWRDVGPCVMLFHFDDPVEVGRPPADVAGPPVFPRHAVAVGQHTPVLPERHLGGVVTTNLPGYETAEYRQLKLMEDEADRYEDMRDELSRPFGDYGHVLGWPDGFSHGNPCAATARVLGGVADDYRTLLQIDEGPGLEWGSGGTGYVVVRDPSLRRGAFDDPWLVVYQ